MKQLSSMYGYVRGRQLEGTYNNDPSIGIWPITALRVGRGWGLPTEEQWPYVGNAALWPPKEEPVNIDQFAKENKIFAYQRVKSLEECKRALANENPVIIAIEITKSWFKAINGLIPMPEYNVQMQGSHSVSLAGYDDEKKILVFRNSWGVQWGDNGYGYLPYDYFALYILEAWIQIPITQDEERIEQSGKKEIRWGIQTCLNNVLHGIEIQDSTTKNSEAWAFSVSYDGYLNVEELFVMPKNRNMGLSKIIFDGLFDLSRKLSLPLRIWISHADLNSINIERIKRLADKYNFMVSDSHVRWASYILSEGGKRISLRTYTSIPGIALPSSNELPRLLLGSK